MPRSVRMGRRIFPVEVSNIRSKFELCMSHTLSTHLLFSTAIDFSRHISYPGEDVVFGSDAQYPGNNIYPPSTPTLNVSTSNENDADDYGAGKRQRPAGKRNPLSEHGAESLAHWMRSHQISPVKNGGKWRRNEGTPSRKPSKANSDQRIAASVMNDLELGWLREENGAAAIMGP